jgi:hypothetical protein
MCESDEFFPNYERLFYVDTRLASRPTGSSMHLLNGVLHSNPIAAQEFGVRRVRVWYRGIHLTRPCQATLFRECFRRILSMCAWSSASILVLASSKLLPRTVSDSSSQTPFQPSSSSQKLQSFGTLANTFSFTARAVIDDSLLRFSLISDIGCWPFKQCHFSSGCSSDIDLPVHCSLKSDRDGPSYLTCRQTATKTRSFRQRPCYQWPSAS